MTFLIKQKGRNLKLHPFTRYWRTYHERYKH